MNESKFHDKVALVTGAGDGIGKATALRLAGEGAKVACLGHHHDNTHATAQEIQKNGVAALTLVADISDYEACVKATKAVEHEWGRLDIVFANAGINGVWAPLDELEPDEFNTTVQINLNGTFHTIKAAYSLLKKRGGSVIITSSVNGNRIFTNSGATAYSCTKAAQIAMTKMLALELADDRIRVNAICPGAIKTNIGQNTTTRDLEKAREPVEFPEGEIPLTDGKPGTVDECAKVVSFLASDESEHVSGSEIYVDGAQSLLQG